MTARIIPVDPFELVVFGGTGDLSLRKLMPALYFRDYDGQIPPQSRIIGVSRKDMTREGYVEMISQAIKRYVPPTNISTDALNRFCGRLDYVRLDASHVHGWERLRTALSEGERKIRVFNLATLPELFGPICGNLATSGLVTSDARVVLEKPIGHALASARRINVVVGVVFCVIQIFRIDLYLGKETVQNLMALRFAIFLF
jgi:glucose-6-phosphate 1-dehydrogenase